MSYKIKKPAIVKLQVFLFFVISVKVTYFGNKIEIYYSAIFILKALFVISTKEKSPQVTLQRKSSLCRASREDFYFVEMTRLWKMGAKYSLPK
jgi:capsule polysaccharide export protein KpsE/RkpR